MIRDQLAAALRTALATLEVEPLPEVIQLERPARREHGDWSSNVALATAKGAGRNPRELASQLVETLLASPPPHVIGVEVAGPGFVNFRLADSWLHDVLAEVLERGVADYARADVGAGTRVMVEFVSANPTGPLHAGHGRGAAYGDSLARVLDRCGYEVHRENYLNDRGTQMQLFAASLAAPPGGPARARGRLPGRVHRRVGQGDPARGRHPHLGRGPSHRGPPRDAGRGCTWSSTPGSARTPWSSRAPSPPRSQTCGPAVGCSTRTARCGCAAPTSATTRTASSSRATASSPTSCPTSPTTATSSPVASTC